MRAPIPLLQRYVFGELLRVFCFVLLCLTVLLVFVGIFQQASESGLGPMQLLRVLPFIVPSLLPFTIPAALLLTVCLVYGRLAGDLEVTAAKAAGISVLSLLWPSFLIGAALSVCCLILSDQAIPGRWGTFSARSSPRWKTSSSSGCGPIASSETGSTGCMSSWRKCRDGD